MVSLTTVEKEATNVVIRPSAHIAFMTFSGGQRIALDEHDKLLIVGPNNSGKSEVLRNIIELCANPHHPSPPAINSIKIEKSGSTIDMEAFLNNNAKRTENGFNYRGWQIGYGQVHLWHTQSLNSPFTEGYVKLVGAAKRLEICEMAESIGPDEQATKPQHVMYDDQELFDHVSDLFEEAFGQELMFDYRGGRKIPIYVGQRPAQSLKDRAGNEYVEQVRCNARLDQQGDGMRGYAGILFECLVSNLDITLLDEPEAFLHPPQMRKLGATLAAECDGQLITSTHSSDILRGFLEATNGQLRIVRVQRDGDLNHAYEAKPDAVRKLWETPALRYSNALEGIFHEQTIVCEDDSDCRIFNAMADYLMSLPDIPTIDIAYVPAGGKHGIPKIAETMREIGVPVKAVFDIDFLNDETFVKRTIEAFGGDWREAEDCYRQLDKAIRSGVSPKSLKEMKQLASRILSEWTSGSPPKGLLLDAFKESSPWSVVKAHGVSGIPNGDAQTTFKQMDTFLRDIGIFVIPVGETENFCRDIGNHGPTFVQNLLRDVPLDSGELEELRKFTKMVIES